MAKQNSENSRRGREFKELVAEILSEYWSTSLDLNVPIPIGKPPKLHKFAIASEDKRIVGETKCFSWTESNNVPSAKMITVNQTVLYLSLLPYGTKRFIVMARDIRPTNGEALADYYYRTNNHLLGDVLIIEVDATSRHVRILEGDD
jgi:hypothetical protein